MRSLSPGLNGAPDLTYVTTRSFVGTYFGTRSKSCTYIDHRNGVLGLDDPRMERVIGNDPTSQRWQRGVIPLYDTRKLFFNVKKIKIHHTNSSAEEIQ